MNDTKTVIDQIPRLLAAMQYIALQETTAAGSFELACQFSRVRQILETRALVDEDPWTQLPGVSQTALRQMEKKAQSSKFSMPSLREVRAMPRSDAAKMLKKLIGKHRMNVDGVLDSVFALPLISVESIQLSQVVEKTTGETTGKLSLEVAISHEKDRHDHNRHNSGPMTVALVLGTPQRRTLLAHCTISASHHHTIKKAVDLEFDWKTANADGGESDGVVILRLLLEDVRGLDSEIVVPLR